MRTITEQSIKVFNECVTFNKSNTAVTIEATENGVPCKELEEFVSGVEFQTVYSPKFYNYSNDAINCEIELSKDNIKNIQEFLKDNNEAFAEYLKDHCTSRSGFVSFFSNTVEGWSEYTKGFTDFTEKPQYLGTILDFICQANELDQDWLYNEVHYTGDLNATLYCEPLEQV